MGKLGKQVGSLRFWKGDRDCQGLSAVRHKWVPVRGFPEEARGIESSKRHMEMSFVNNVAASPRTSR